MTNPTRSKYQDAWELLKTNKEIKLAASAKAHPRLIEAIKKRKKLDIAYKVILDSSEDVAKLEFHSTPLLLTVKLNIRKRSTWL